MNSFKEKEPKMAEQFRDIGSLLSDESFQRWLSGKATADETKQWTAWLNEMPSHRELHELALQLWQLAQVHPVTSPNIEHEWRRLRDRLHLPRTHPAAIHELASGADGHGRDRGTLQVWARYGAIAAAAVAVFALLWRFWPLHSGARTQDFQQVATEYGQRARISLSDSTTIILNAHSSLRYPAAWTAATAREFELQGEAYFDVSPLPQGPQRDFVVHTDDGVVRVVGTRFDVHERGQGTRVVVEKGGVEVTVADAAAVPKATPSKVLLRPGHLLHFQKGIDALNPRFVNLGLYTTWWQDHLTLEDTPFANLVRQLEETYGIHVEVNDEQLLQRTLSGSIENRSLDVITEALAKALRVTVQRKGQSVVFGNSPK